MNGQATFTAANPVAALAIPREAFDGSVLDGKVYVVEKNVVHLRKVRPGAIRGSYVEILDGLSAGETIVLTGQVNLADGAEVKVVE
jgi:multidrug efflux pump subunit AcrA (membrane-fusion protein)